MRRGGTEVTAERLQNTIGLRCEGTTPERGWDAGERERKTETYWIYSYHCRAWRLVAFSSVFNKHIYTFPSHWTWFKGWLEFVDTQLSFLGPRPEHTPFSKYTCTMSRSRAHTHPHTHSHICWLVKSLAQLCTGSGLSHYTHAHSVITWEQPRDMWWYTITGNHVCTLFYACMLQAYKPTVMQIWIWLCTHRSLYLHSNSHNCLLDMHR